MVIIDIGFVKKRVALLHNRITQAKIICAGYLAFADFIQYLGLTVAVQ